MTTPLLDASMNIKILYDSAAINRNLKVGWGFSCLINDHILFDAGENGNALLTNLHLLNITVDNIDRIVISHEHFDHADGLWTVLEKRKKISVYACPNFNESFKAKVKSLGSCVIESKPYQEITPNIFTTGALEGIYKDQTIPEQALIIKTQKGLVVITGCAHPGIISILNKIKTIYPADQIYWVIGGFHLRDESEVSIEKIASQFKRLGVKKVSPIHCSGEKAEAIFKNIQKCIIKGTC